jgi:hypothetical protein
MKAHAAIRLRVRAYVELFPITSTVVSITRRGTQHQLGLPNQTRPNNTLPFESLSGTDHDVQPPKLLDTLFDSLLNHLLLPNVTLDSPHLGLRPALGDRLLDGLCGFPEHVKTA